MIQRFLGWLNQPPQPCRRQAVWSTETARIRNALAEAHGGNPWAVQTASGAAPVMERQAFWRAEFYRSLADLEVAPA